MRSYGLTKARSMGPVAELVERSGGSIARVFRRGELPLRLIEEPDRLILLKDQLNLVECAAREIGDDALAARLSTEAGVAGLGPYGQQTAMMPRRSRARLRQHHHRVLAAILDTVHPRRLRRLRKMDLWSHRSDRDRAAEK